MTGGQFRAGAQVTAQRASAGPTAAGLSSAEAARRPAADGANVLPERHRTGLARRVLLQLRDPLIPVLLAAAVLTIATGDWTDASVIIAVIVINTTVGVAQDRGGRNIVHKVRSSVTGVGDSSKPSSYSNSDQRSRQISTSVRLEWSH